MPIRMSTLRSIEGDVCVRASSMSGSTISCVRSQKRILSSSSVSPLKYWCACSNVSSRTMGYAFLSAAIVSSIAVSSVFVSAARNEMSSGVGW